jgi:methionine sulfoxide reductase catalytic subunit
LTYGNVASIRRPRRRVENNGRELENAYVRRRGWEIAERQVAPEHAVFNRRSVLAGVTAMTILPSLAAADVTANPAFKPDRAVTDEKYATTYNNYYEFGENKNIWRSAQALNSGPGRSSWTG